MKKFNCILLIDDDESCNFITEKIITKLDLSDHTHSLKNGKEALRFIEENCYVPSADLSILCPDLILLDINMPVMDGEEFLEEFYNKKNIGKDQAKGLNIYILSSSDNKEDVEKFKKYNVKGHITKPMTFDKLKNIASA